VIELVEAGEPGADHQHVQLLDRFPVRRLGELRCIHLDFLPGCLADELSRWFEKWALVLNISDLIIRSGGSQMDGLGSLNAFVQAAGA
jgi:hypothetical protein